MRNSLMNIKKSFNSDHLHMSYQTKKHSSKNSFIPILFPYLALMRGLRSLRISSKRGNNSLCRIRNTDYRFSHPCLRSPSFVHPKTIILSASKRKNSSAPGFGSSSPVDPVAPNKRNSVPRNTLPHRVATHSSPSS